MGRAEGPEGEPEMFIGREQRESWRCSSVESADKTDVCSSETLDIYHTTSLCWGRGDDPRSHSLVTRCIQNIFIFMSLNMYYILNIDIIVIKYDIFINYLETHTFEHERSIKLECMKYEGKTTHIMNYGDFKISYSRCFAYVFNPEHLNT